MARGGGPRNVHERRADGAHAIVGRRRRESAADGIAVRAASRSTMALRHAKGDQAAVPASVRDDPAGRQRRTRAIRRRTVVFRRPNRGRADHNAVLSGKAAGRPQRPETIRRDDTGTSWPRRRTQDGQRGGMDQDCKPHAMKRTTSSAKASGTMPTASGCRMAACAGRSTGRFCRRSNRWRRDKWLYVAGTFDGRQCACMWMACCRPNWGAGHSTGERWVHARKADEQPGGRQVAVVTRVRRRGGHASLR